MPVRNQAPYGPVRMNQGVIFSRCLFLKIEKTFI